MDASTQEVASKEVSIKIAATEQEVMACFPVMKSLRENLTETLFSQGVQEMSKHGYKLAYLMCNDMVCSVAGFRIAESFAWGKYIYVDDLASSTEYRSRGYGAKLLSWLNEYAKKEGCTHLHLDTAVTRHAAQKFYFNQGMIIGGYHFARAL